MDVRKLVMATAICELIGLAGSYFTLSSIGTWYVSLNKPSFNPPNWIFGPVWTVLYLLMGISIYLVWEKLKKRKFSRPFYIFGTQLALNLLWTILFFGLHQILYAFIEIVILWIVILLTILEFRKYSSTAALILLPYIAWVTFAALLNYAIFLIN